MRALSADLTHAANLTSPRPLTSLYFGGGTPSLCPPSILQAVIDQCASLYGFEPDAEITLEANPTDLTRQTMKTLNALGVNRLSLGVQSFDDRLLNLLGRDHTAAQARFALTNASEIFGNVTFDLIYGHPDQSRKAWDNDLDMALSFETGHVSLYQLTIEPGTAYAKSVERGSLVPAGDDDLAGFYDHAIQRLTEAGFEHYEISNFARPGFQAKHNMIYWQYQDYIGIGPGAHGRLSVYDSAQVRPARLETITHRRPAEYLRATTDHGNGLSHSEALGDEAQMFERFALGLRLRAGIDLTNDDFFFADPTRAARLQTLIENGLLLHQDQRLIASDQGRAILDWVLGQLLT